MECAICCEKLNASNHKKVTCPFCDFNSCRTCVQTYLLSVSSDPHCMSCKQLWTREVVDGACTKVFRDTKLKKHRETILFERERCLLPETQDAVARILQVRKIDKRIEEANEEIMRIRVHIASLHNARNRVGSARQQPEQEKRVFVRKCPVEECRGFLSTRWKCQICENNICPDCNEIKHDDEHACDPGNVETVALLKKDTKPCPKCGTMIFKISGCSQMWCPDCHTAFDWNTMRIETGRIHNPHYYEFNRAGGRPQREHGDIPCGGIPSIEELTVALDLPLRNRRYMLPIVTGTTEQVEVFKIHRLVLHVQHMEIADERAVDNRELRIKYLMHELSEDDMKVILQKNEKAREKARDRNNLLRMFCDVTGDLLRQLVLKVTTVPEFLENVTRLRDYTRDAFTTIHRRYTCTTDWISDSWDFTRNSYHKQIAAE